MYHILRTCREQFTHFFLEMFLVCDQASRFNASSLTFFVALKNLSLLGIVNT
jgi:hypothetical protein